MIITDDFVMINYPKTGSTFARDIIFSIYARSGRKIVDLSLPVITNTTEIGNKSQHGTVEQIPVEHRHKKIVSILRNPFDRYVSLYAFKWWHKIPPAPINIIKSKFKSFPNLSFSEYIQMTMEYSRSNVLKAYNYLGPVVSGLDTLQHIAYYSRNPFAAFEALSTNGNTYSSIEPYMENVTFLSQQRLRKDICNYLNHCGFDDEQLEPIMSAPELNVSRSSELESWEKYYDSKLYDEVAILEQPLLEKFNYILGVK